MNGETAVDDTAPPATGGYKPSFARAPFVFGLTRARALPGPILVDLMSDLGGSPAANKALLHRMVTHGALDVSRVGRVGVYRMARLLLAGFIAVRGDNARQSEPWDGRFHALVYDIPESRRRQRDQFLASAFQAGYRMLRRGVLIAPTNLSATVIVPRPDDVTRGWLSVAEADLEGVVARTWQLDAFRAEYETEIARVKALLADDLSSRSGPDALRLLYAASSAQSGLMLREGFLPSELRPANWPAERLVALVSRVEERLSAEAVAHVAAVLASSPHRDLVEGDPSWDAVV